MPAIHTPDWVKDAVFYQIFPDRFARSAQLAKPNNLEAWEAPPTPQGYKGGDLLGVLEHLDHIQDLGATAIYFCPLFQSACNHRYHTHDYYQVDPLLGGNDAFLKLLDEAHRRRIKIVLDGVFNHASRGFFQFSDLLENGPHSAWLDWFIVHDWPLSPYDGDKPANYAAWWNNRALPKLNTDNPQVREFIMRVAEHWLRLGIDGWRLDVPAEIKTPGFWEEFRRRAKAINPDAYIVGEIWEPAVEFLRGDRFDAVMNYLFADSTIAFAGGPRVAPEVIGGKSYKPDMNLDAPGYAKRIAWILGLYPWEIQLAQLNLLDSHDASRVITLCGGDGDSVHLATLLLMTYPGAPSIYYGDEIGLEGGGPDHDIRRTFPWSRPEAWKRDVLNYHKELIALRKAHPALRRGTYHVLYAKGHCYAFARKLEGDVLLVAVNAGEKPHEIQIPVKDLMAEGATLRAVYGKGGGRVIKGKAALTVAGRDGVVMK
jgi:glycosidase